VCVGGRDDRIAALAAAAIWEASNALMDRQLKCAVPRWPLRTRGAGCVLSADAGETALLC